MTDTSEQFLRKCTLIVSGNDGQGLDLSEFRIKFSVKRSPTMTPNIADIRVYNLEQDTAIYIRKEFTRVILQAGYEGNFGVIFQGNIKQVILGRESATDTFIDIIAGDGDLAYNFSVVNTTLQAGATQSDQIDAASKPMGSKGVTKGYIGELPPEQLPRGKVMWGSSKNYLRNIASTTNKEWSIQDEKITFVSNTSYLPGQAVVLTSKTGMIGTPQQTNEGINVKCLLNPLIKVAKRIQIDNASLALFKIDLNNPTSAANIPAPTTADGVYYVLVAEHSGDTRGVDWYTSVICLNLSVTASPVNSVQVNYGS